MSTYYEAPHCSQEITLGWRKLDNEELHNSYSAQNVMMIK
jgi:hypothetical protein